MKWETKVQKKYMIWNWTGEEKCIDNIEEHQEYRVIHDISMY